MLLTMGACPTTSSRSASSNRWCSSPCSRGEGRGRVRDHRVRRAGRAHEAARRARRRVHDARPAREEGTAVLLSDRADVGARRSSQALLSRDEACEGGAAGVEARAAQSVGRVGRELGAVAMLRWLTDASLADSIAGNIRRAAAAARPIVAGRGHAVVLAHVYGRGNLSHGATAG